MASNCNKFNPVYKKAAKCYKQKTISNKIPNSKKTEDNLMKA